MGRIFAKLLYMLEKKLDTVLVTIIANQGSAPLSADGQRRNCSGRSRFRSNFQRRLEAGTEQRCVLPAASHR